MIELIIFDFDDTIIDNDVIDYQSFVFSFKKFGIKKPFAKDIKKFRKQGLIADDIILKYVEPNNKVLLNNIQHYRNIFLKKKSNVFYFKLKSNLLNNLKYFKREGIDCILCSSRDEKHIIQNFLKQKELNQFFTSFYFKKDLKFKINNSTYSNRTKIKTKLLSKIIKKSIYNKNKIVYIGNSEEDFYAAKNNDINFIYFQNDYLPKFNNPQNRVVIKDMKHLIGKLSTF